MAYRPKSSGAARSVFLLGRCWVYRV